MKKHISCLEHWVADLIHYLVSYKFLFHHRNVSYMKNIFQKVSHICSNFHNLTGESLLLFVAGRGALCSSLLLFLH